MIRSGLAYKIVRNNTNNMSYFSVFTPPECSSLYILNTLTIPKIEYSKLFVFRTLKNTINYYDEIIGCCRYIEKNKFSILFGTGYNISSIKKISAGFNLNTLSSFWKIRKNKKSNRDVMSTIENSYICDSFLPLAAYPIDQCKELLKCSGELK